jgi:hypothetical protein
VKWIKTIPLLRIVLAQLGQKRKVKDFSFCPSLRVLFNRFDHQVTPKGFEPLTFGTGNQHSIQLNYGAVIVAQRYACRAESHLEAQ